jgi:hypothetical protein
MSIPTISSLSPIRLTLHLVVELPVEVASSSLGVDWSAVAAVLVRPTFRHPIELHIRKLGIGVPPVQVVFSFEQNSDIRRLLMEGKLAITKVEI